MAYDPTVIRELLAGASRKRASPRELLSALETGIVESGLRNLPGGDADSAGWRQERSSIYKNPTNLRASIDRYFDEARAANKGGGSAGDLAAAVQRPAAKYRGRYGAVADEARKLLRGGGFAATGGGPARASSTTTTGPATPNLESGVDLTGLLRQMQPQAQGPPVSMPAAPAHSAHPTLPQGYQGTVSPAGTGKPEAPQLEDMLSLVRSQGGAVSTPGQTTTTTTAAAQGAGSGKPIANVADVLARAATIDAKRLPYSWGGGHGGRVDPAKAEPLDCSGAVSAALGIDPRVSSDFEKFGSAGRSPSGKGITIYANKGHVLMEINGHFWGTSHENPGGGAGWIPRSAISKQYLSRFTARHLSRAEG